MKRVWVILLVVLLVGTGLRFVRLGSNPPSYFSDEIDIAYQIRSLLETGRDYEGNFLPLQIHSFSDTRTAIPIYLTLGLTLLPRVDGLLAVRVVPAVFGVLGIFFTFLLLNSLFTEQAPWVGVMGAFLLAVTPWHIHYSRTGFEVSILYCFVVGGLYFFDRYQKGKRFPDGTLAWILLALIPLVYSTAKLSVVFLPLALWFWPNLKSRFFGSWTGWLFALSLVVPLAVVILNGGAAKRFWDIAVFTDPVVSSRVNYERQLALGPAATPGSSPSIFDIVANNKVSYWIGAVVENTFRSLSFDFLFVNGDTLARHSLPGLGLVDKSLVVLIAAGLGVMASQYKRYWKMMAVLGILVFFAVIPSAVTRDGATHATRLFLLLIPLIIVAAFGLAQIFLFKRWLGAVIVVVICYETFVYAYAYYTRYPLESARLWHYGIKEAVEISKEYPDRSVVITTQYENPLIFYLYFRKVSPALFQRYFSDGSYLQPVASNLNLAGNKFDGQNVYFARIANKNEGNPLKLNKAVYFLTDVDINEATMNKAVSEVRLPSGEGVYWVFLTN